MTVFNGCQSAFAALLFALGLSSFHWHDVVASAAIAPLTEKDLALLAEFDNQTGDPVFDHSLKQALMLELGQSPFLNLISERRLHDALRALGRPDNDRFTTDSGRDVCARSGGKIILGGSISGAGSRYLIALRAVACAGAGTMLAEEHAEARDKQDVLSVVSLASSRLRTKLGEPPQSLKQFDVPVTAATGSLEALSDYSTGVALRRARGDEASIALLRQATEHDPGFPLAYAELAAIYRNLRQPSLAVGYASKAYRLRDRLSEREKLHVASTYFLVTGEVDQEIPIYERWQEIYPRDYVPYNNLGNADAALGQLERALSQYQTALRIMPSLIGYTNVVGMQITLCRLDEAQATFAEAFESGFDGGYLHQNLYWLAFLRGDTALMQQQVAWASGKAGDEDALLSIQSDTEAYEGRLHDAQEFTQRAVDSAVRADARETAALWQVNGALREAEVGDMAAARQGVAAALVLSSGRDVKLISAFALARAHNVNQAKALLEELEKDYPTDTLMKHYWLPAIHASIELATANYLQALKDLKPAAPYEFGNAGMFINYLYPAYVRGEGYLRVHNGAAAAIEFQKLLDHRGIVSNFVTGALARVQLGRAYAMAGNTTKAREAYQQFFALWKTADSTVPLLQHAKVEYSKLRT